MDTLWRRHDRGPGRWHYSNVARCGFWPARFGATLPNALTVTLNSGTAHDHMPARSAVVKVIRDHWKVAICAKIKRHRAAKLIGIMRIAVGLAILLAFPTEKGQSATPTIKIPGPYPYETPLQVPAPPPVSDSSPLPAPAPFPYPESSPSLSGAQDRDSRTENAGDRKSTRLNSSHVRISYAVFCL